MSDTFFQSSTKQQVEFKDLLTLYLLGINITKEFTMVEKWGVKKLSIDINIIGQNWNILMFFSLSWYFLTDFYWSWNTQRDFIIL